MKKIDSLSVQDLFNKGVRDGMVIGKVGKDMMGFGFNSDLLPLSGNDRTVLALNGLGILLSPDAGSATEL